MQSTVLILGARGRFGLAAVRAFAAAGWRVVAQTRPDAVVPADVAQDPRVQWVGIELDDHAALVRAAGAASVVVHALNPAYTQKAWCNEVLRMLDKSIEVARALKATFMLPGNVYNFGKSMPAVLREDTVQAAQTVKGQIRIAMEAQLQRSGVRAIVIRAGDFFGAGHGTWFDQVIVKHIRQGRVTYPGPREVATTWAYLPDLAHTFVAVTNRREQLASFAVLHFAGHSLTGQQWIDTLTKMARAQGWITAQAELKVAGMPWPLIRMLAWLVPTWAALVEMAYLWTTPYALANDKLTALIGPEPHTALDVAAGAAIADLFSEAPAALPA